MIYFIRAATGEGAIKIGTTIRLSQRLKQLEKEHGVPLRVLGVMDGSYADESALHARFVRTGEAREWFQANPELTDFIAAEARPWDGYNRKIRGFIVRLTDEAIEAARIASGYTGESMAEYVSRITVERANEDAERLHAERYGVPRPKTGKVPKGKGEPK